MSFNRSEQLIREFWLVLDNCLPVDGLCGEYQDLLNPGSENIEKNLKIITGIYVVRCVVID